MTTSSGAGLHATYAPLQESDFHKFDIYRGEVIPYYPNSAAAAGDELYLAVAQVQDGSNLSEGIPRLEQEIEKFNPKEPEFHFQLAEAYSKSGSRQQGRTLVSGGAPARWWLSICDQ